MRKRGTGTEKTAKGAERGKNDKDEKKKKKSHTTGERNWAPKHQRLLRTRNEAATQ